MKKRVLLMLSMVAVLACMLALAVSAESVHSGKVDLSATVTLDDGTVCNLFDAEGNALIWFKNGSELQSIRADDEKVRYKATYAFNVGNSTVGSVTVYEVTDMWIQLDANTKISKGSIVVLNLMDDDVLVNEATNNSYLNKPVNCLKGVAWANKIIEYAYCRLDTSALQQQAFCGCDKLKYINLEDLTELRQIGGGQTFGQSTALFKGQSLDLTGTKLCAISGNGAFNSVPVAEIKLPKTVTSLGDWNIQGTAITSFIFPEGVATIAGSQFKNCASLNEIYINNTTTKINGDAFLSTKAFEKIFFVGTKAELEALVANTSSAGNSTFLAVAENIISYADYLALADKSGKYAVYGYSYCEAYNDGVHTMSGNATMQFDGYFNTITYADVCTVDGCGTSVVDTSKSIGALFVDYGYSYTETAINGSFSMSQFFGINREALAAYTEATGNTVEYGLVVSVSNNPLAEENSDLIAQNKTFITAQDRFKHDYFAINVSGIKDGTEEGTKDTREKALTFCAYVIDNGKVYYLDDGKTLEVATQKSYNDILGK